MDMKSNVIINFKKDARNNLISTVEYGCGQGLQEAYEMDNGTLAFACKIGKKIIANGDVEGLVVINALTMQEIKLGSTDLDNVSCFISGSDPGYSEKMIKCFKEATSDIEIGAPCYVTDGEISTTINRDRLFENIGRSIDIVDYQSSVDEKLNIILRREVSKSK